MALASRATMLQSKVVPDRAAEPSITQMNTPLNIAKPINSPFRPSRTPDAQTRQVELARQMFHENQVYESAHSNIVCLILNHIINDLLGRCTSK